MAKVPQPGEIWEVDLTGGHAHVRVSADPHPKPKWVIFEIVRGTKKFKAGEIMALPIPGSRIPGSSQWKRLVSGGAPRAAAAAPAASVAKPRPRPAPKRPVRRTAPPGRDENRKVTDEDLRRGVEIATRHFPAIGFSGLVSDAKLEGELKRLMLAHSSTAILGEPYVRAGYGKIHVSWPITHNRNDKRVRSVGGKQLLELVRSIWKLERGGEVTPIPVRRGPRAKPAKGPPSPEKIAQLERGAPTVGRLDWLGSIPPGADHLLAHPNDRPPTGPVQPVPDHAARDRVVRLLLDGRARTFNAIAGELANATAEQARGTALERAVLELTQEGVLERGASVPVMFRMRSSALEAPPAIRPAASAPGPIANGTRWLVLEQGVTWPGEVVEHDLAGPFGGYVTLRFVQGDRAVGEPHTVFAGQLVRELE